MGHVQRCTPVRFVQSCPREMQALTFRPAHPDEVDRLIEIHTLAFPDRRGHEERRRNFLAKPFGPFADLHVAVLSEGGHDELVGHAFGFGLTVFVGGAPVPVTGIATVGIAPEARGHGIAKALVEHVVSVGEEAGAVASFLYPFRQGFYARMGYVSAPHVLHVSIATEALALLAKVGAGAGKSLRVRRTTGADRGVLQELYAAEARRTTGLIARSERLWNIHFADERRAIFLAERDGRASGYVSLLTHQHDAHGVIRSEVVDLVGETFVDRRDLLAWIGVFRDQVAEVDLCLSSDDPLFSALLDLDVDRKRFGSPQIEHPLGVIGAGPMLRLGSARRALAARGYRHDGVLDVTVLGGAGEVAAEERFGLEVTNGVAKVVPSTDGPRVVFAPEGLAAVTFGGTPLSQCSRLGWVSGDEDALLFAGRILEVPAWHTWDRF